jgi:hypothetical protein
MGVIKPMISLKFGRLTVIELAYIKRSAYWKCQCECGNIVIVQSNSLRSGKTKSCGCLGHDALMKRNITHGNTHTRLYRIWGGMKARCYIPTASGYKHYGAKGIRVYDNWLDFSLFKNWAYTNGYNNSLTIERKDNNGNYEPDNCIWIPGYRQASNTSKNVFIYFNGKKQTLADWAKELRIQESTIRYRYHKGLPLEEVLSEIDRRTVPSYYGRQTHKNFASKLKGGNTIGDSSQKSN